TAKQAPAGPAPPRRSVCAPAAMSRHWIADQPGMGERTMSLHSWLQNLRSALTPGQRHPPRRSSLPAGARRPHFEVLEDRLTPSTFMWDGTSSPEAPPGFVWQSSPPLLADCTSDGILDRIDLGVVVRPGRGDGTFGDPIYSTSPYAHTLAVADFNGDGRVDVFTLNYPAPRPPDWVDRSWGSVLWGVGDGTFAYAGEDYGFGDYMAALGPIGFGDIFGSGRTDVVVYGERSGVEFDYIYV